MISNSKLNYSVRVVSVFVVVSVFAGLLAGCGSPLMKCEYRQGDVQKIRYSSSTENRIWVEKSDTKRQQTGQNMVRNEMVMTREVESVAPDGSAIMKVTFEEVNIEFESNVGKRSKKGTYRSTIENTTTSQPGEPALAGNSYKIRIAPDTTVLEIMGLDALRKKLGVSVDDELRVAKLLSEKNIRQSHECDFVRYAPKSAFSAKRYEKNVRLPSGMIKAKALKKIYTIDESAGAESIPADKRNLIAVELSGEPLYVLPKDVEESESPQGVFPSMIKEMSDMQELNVSGIGFFDSATGTVLKSQENIECILSLAESKVTKRFKGKSGKESPNEMLTSVTIKRSYSIID